jgi:hypothetical protein
MIGALASFFLSLVFFPDQSLENKVFLLIKSIWFRSTISVYIPIGLNSTIFGLISQEKNINIGQNILFSVRKYANIFINLRKEVLNVFW